MEILIAFFNCLDKVKRIETGKEKNTIKNEGRKSRMVVMSVKRGNILFSYIGQNL
jgi:electron transfer flavoprotein alpha/beta subunit